MRLLACSAISSPPPRPTLERPHHAPPAPRTTCTMHLAHHAPCTTHHAPPAHAHAPSAAGQLRGKRQGCLTSDRASAATMPAPLPPATEQLGRRLPPTCQSGCHTASCRGGDSDDACLLDLPPSSAVGPGCLSLRRAQVYEIGCNGPRPGTGVGTASTGGGAAPVAWSSCANRRVDCISGWTSGPQVCRPDR